MTPKTDCASACSADETILSKPFSILVGHVSVCGIGLHLVGLKQDPYGLKDWIASANERGSILYDGKCRIIADDKRPLNLLKLAEEVNESSCTGFILTKISDDTVSWEWHPSVDADSKLFKARLRVGRELHEFRYPQDVARYEILVAEPTQKRSTMYSLQEVQDLAATDPNMHVFTVDMDLVRFESSFACILTSTHGSLINIKGRSLHEWAGRLSCKGHENRWEFYSFHESDMPLYRSSADLTGTNFNEFYVTFCGTWKNIQELIELRQTKTTYFS